MSDLNNKYGQEYTPVKKSDKQDSEEVEVKLHMYDLSFGMASQFSQAVTGTHFDAIWHTGIVVYGYEYFFGGGIMRMPAGQTPYGRPTKTSVLGKTKVSRTTFEEFLNYLRRTRFTISAYNLFENNCNNFTNEASVFLTGNPIPSEVSNLPTSFLNTTMGQMMRGQIDQMMGGGNPDQIRNAAGNMNLMGNMMNPSTSNTQSGQTNPTPNPSSNPTPSSNPMQNMFGSGGGNNPLGNMDLNAMMQDPAIQNMARQMMGSGGLDNLMGGNASGMFGNNGSSGGNNPFGSGGGNNPLGNMDLNAMMQDPAIQNMARQMMGSGGSNPFGGMQTPTNNNSFSNSTNNNSQPNVSNEPKVYVDDKAIYRYKKSDVPKVVEKLKSNVSSGEISLNSEEEDTLENLKKFLINEPKDFSLINDGAFDLLKKLLGQNEKKIFPVVDLIRLLVLNQFIAKKLMKQKDGVLDALESCMKKWKTLSMPSQLMLLRVYTNIFAAHYAAKDAGASYIIHENEDRFSTIADCISHSMSSKLEGIRLTATSLACNISLYITKEGNDEEVQILSSMIELLKTEKKEDIILKVLLVIYRVLKDNNLACEIVKTLEPDFSSFKTHSNVNIKSLSNEISKMI